MNITIVNFYNRGKLQTQMFSNNETDKQICDSLTNTFGKFTIQSILKAVDAHFVSLYSINQYKTN